MISTFAQVKTRALALLDDDLQAVFVDAVLLPAIGEAIEALYSGFLLYQIPRAKQIVYYTLPANTTSLTPATAGIADFGELIQMEERRSGSTDKFTHIYEVNDLTQRDKSDSLGEFAWWNDTFQFVGATTARQLRITYFTTVTPPTVLDSTTTGVDAALPFLSKYAAAMAAPRKGYYELGEKYKIEAVGPKYDLGVIGGELFRLLQPMVRSMQQVQTAPKPYSIVRRRMVRRPPYIAATQPAGVAGSPIQFTTADGTMTGSINGSNLVFYLAYPVSSVSNLSVNGSLKTQGALGHYTHSANQITFTAGNAPATGPITCNGYL